MKTNYVFLFTLCFALYQSCAPLKNEKVYEYFIVNDSNLASKSIFFKSLGYDPNLKSLLAKKEEHSELTFRYGFKANIVKPLDIDLKLKGFKHIPNVVPKYVISIYDLGAQFDFDCAQRSVSASLRYVLKNQSGAIVFDHTYTATSQSENLLGGSVEKSRDKTVAHVYRELNKQFITDLSKIKRINTTNFNSKITSDFKPLGTVCHQKLPPYMLDFKIDLGVTHKGDALWWIKQEFYNSKRNTLTFGIMGAKINTSVIDALPSYSELDDAPMYYTAGFKKYFNCTKGPFFEGGLLMLLNPKIKNGSGIGYYLDAGYHWRLSRSFSLQPYLSYQKLKLQSTAKSYALDRFGIHASLNFHVF